MVKPAGLSESGLKGMHGVMAGYVERGAIPGIVTAVSRHGETHLDVLGEKAIGSGDRIARDTIFRIASLTKPITAAAAMILVEECVLRLDEPVDGFLPELADRRVLKHVDGPLDQTVPASRPITMRDLLTFRLGYGIVMLPWDSTPIQRAMSELALGQGPPNPDATPEPDEWIRRLGTLPLLHQPGERWMYNTGSDVLGVLIARASGQPLEAFLRERLFDPLGMKDTGFSVPAASIERLSTAYVPNPHTGALDVSDAPDDSQWGRRPSFGSAAGGLVSTVDDVLAFGQMMLHGGRHGSQRVLSRPTVETMTTDQLTQQQKANSYWPGDFFADHGWGFGMAVVTRRDNPPAPIGQFGWDGGSGTSMWVAPSEDLVGVLLTQVAWTSPLGPNVSRDFWTSAYQALDD